MNIKDKIKEKILNGSGVLNAYNEALDEKFAESKIVRDLKEEMEKNKKKEEDLRKEFEVKEEEKRNDNIYYEQWYRTEFQRHRKK